MTTQERKEMNEFPKEAKMIGVDLDKTLAIYEGWKGVNHIGAPIKPMVDKVKAELAKGTEVHIVTARANPWKGKSRRNRAVRAIEKWTKEHVGQKLKVTCEKHPMMTELWDDIARQVVPNEGTFK